MEITQDGFIAQTVKFASPYDYRAYSIVEQSDGGIAISGSYSSGAIDNFFIIRLDSELHYCGDLDPQYISLVA